MPAWLTQHIGTILICAVLIAFFALLIRSLVRDRKKGKSSCCGGCAGCAMAGHCHPNTVKPADSPTDMSEGNAPTESTEAGV